MVPTARPRAGDKLQAVKATETSWQGKEIKVSGLIFPLSSIFLEFAWKH